MAQKFNNIPEIANEQDLLNYIRTWIFVCQHSLYYYVQKYRDNNNAAMNADEIGKIDVQLNLNEFSIVQTLYKKDDGQKKYAAYCQKDKEITEKLFFSTDYSNAVLTADLNELYSLISNDSDLSKLKVQRDTLFTQLKAYNDFIKIHQDQSVDFDIKCIRRLYLKRKLLFLNHLESHIWIGADPDPAVKTIKNQVIFGQLASLVRDQSDCNYAIVDEIFNQTQPVRLQEGTNDYKDYTQYQKNLSDLNKSISDATKKLDIKDTKQMSDYKSLLDQREALNHILAEKKSSLSIMSKAKATVQQNKSSAALEAGKVLAFKSGETLGIALLNELMHKGDKNDWKKIGASVALDVAEAGLTGLMTLALGPLGGKLAGMAIGFLRPTPPDPYMVEFGKIEKELDGINNKLDDKFNKLEDRIEELVDDLKKYGKKTADLSGIYAVFYENVVTLNENLKKAAAIHRDVFEKGRTYTDLGQLMDLDQLIQENIESMIAVFYHWKYDLGGQNEFKAVDTDSLSYHIIETNQSAKILFMDTAAELANKADTIMSLVELYNKNRPDIFSLLAVEMTFFSDTGNRDKVKIFETLFDFHEEEPDVKAALFEGAFTLNQRVTGINNHSLYELLAGMEQESVYDPNTNKNLLWPVYDFSQGFGLANTDGKSLYYDEAGKKFMTENVSGYYSRFYGQKDSQNKFQWCNIRTGKDRKWFDCEFLLDINDRILLKVNDVTTIAHAVLSTDNVFNGTIEQFFKMEGILTTDGASGDAHLQLPVMNHSFRITAMNESTPSGPAYSFEIAVFNGQQMIWTTKLPQQKSIPGPPKYKSGMRLINGNVPHRTIEIDGYGIVVDFMPWGNGFDIAGKVYDSLTLLPIK